MRLRFNINVLFSPQAIEATEKIIESVLFISISYDFRALRLTSAFNLLKIEENLQWSNEAKQSDFWQSVSILELKSTRIVNKANTYKSRARLTDKKGLRMT